MEKIINRIKALFKRTENNPINFKELFITQHLSGAAYAAVIYDYNEKAFFSALFELTAAGAGSAYVIKEKGTKLSPEAVKKAAGKSDDSRAAKFADMTKENMYEYV